MGTSWLPRSYGTRELAIRFALWAEQLRQCPTAEQVMEHFNISRPGAYRFIADYRAAKGLPPLPKADNLAAYRTARAKDKAA